MSSSTAERKLRTEITQKLISQSALLRNFIGDITQALQMSKTSEITKLTVVLSLYICTVTRIRHSAIISATIEQ